MSDGALLWTCVAFRVKFCLMASVPWLDSGSTTTLAIYVNKVVINKRTMWLVVLLVVVVVVAVKNNI